MVIWKAQKGVHKTGKRLVANMAIKVLHYLIHSLTFNHRINAALLN